MLLCEYGRKNEHVCNGVKLAPEYTEEHRGTQEYTGVHRSTQGYTGVHRGTQEYTGVHRSAQLPLQMISVVIRGMVH